MTTKIIEQWYSQLLEDCRDITVETEFASNWALVEGRHLLGSRILQDYEKAQLLRMPDSELVQRIALSIQRHKRTVYYAIQFARMFPDLNLLKEGKNLSWSHIINKYLTTGEKKPAIKKADLYRMIKDIRELLEHERLESMQTDNDEVFLHDRGAEGVIDYFRYLQGQVNKITEGLDGR